MGITTFEGHIKTILIEMEEKTQEYEANINDPVVNPKMENTHYFRGKADAYRYASKQIRECLKWHGKMSGGVVENFAHEPTKEPQTEALNKHNVSGSLPPIKFADELLSEYEMATFDNGDLCWVLAGTNQKYTTEQIYKILSGNDR